MLGKAFNILILLQIILKTSVFSTQYEKGEGHTIENEDEEDIIDLENNGNNQSNEYQDLHDYKKVRHKDKIKSEAWNFKFAKPRKEERGFDLSSKEMEKFKIWKGGVIPYYIDVVSFSDKVLRDKIRSFLQMVNSAARLSFVELANPPADDKERWVFIINRRGLLGCADHTVKNFSNQGVQQVVLGYDCMATKAELAEAVMSIVGVPAQHNAPDRDKYIDVKMDNIMPDKQYLFEKLNDGDWLFHDLPYDFDSITHYDLYKYSVNGRPTIGLKKNVENFIPAASFSAGDLRKMKMLYTYISKNKKMQVPVCQKLFKISSKYNRDRKPFKPRKKPSRYLGIAGAANDKSEEQTEDSKQDEDNDESNDEKRQYETEDDNKKDEENDENVSKYRDKGSETDVNKHSKENDDANSNTDDGKSHVTGEIHRENLKGKLKPLKELSDYDSSVDNKQQELKGSYELPDDTKRIPLKGFVKMDPLSILSDYQTDYRK